MIKSCNGLSSIYATPCPLSSLSEPLSSPFAYSSLSFKVPCAHPPWDAHQCCSFELTHFHPLVSWRTTYNSGLSLHRISLGTPSKLLTLICIFALFSVVLGTIRVTSLTSICWASISPSRISTPWRWEPNHLSSSIYNTSKMSSL